MQTELIKASEEAIKGDTEKVHKAFLLVAEELKQNEVSQVYIAGLATDYCVKFTALDAVELGFATTLIEDASRGVNLQEGDVKKAVAEMANKGVNIVQSASLM